ncbi:MAG: type IV toxin-antitoxin system AbiEi family antitoxin domain-containing protein [Verrucomicrobiota bacterium]
MPIKYPFTLPTGSPLISHGQLKDALRAYGNPRMKVSRMQAAGELIPLRRGLYLRDRSVDPLTLAPAIYGPSYVSFESALAWHGVIPERVEEVGCATLKRPAEFETPVGRYRYRHVPARVFSIGVQRVEDPLFSWLLASPTKALCDSVALDASIRSQKDVRVWLEAMRIEDLPPLDQAQLAACAAGYGRPAVRHLARYFLKTPTPR